MLILLSSEDGKVQELDCLKTLFALDSDFRFHVRKPHWSEAELRRYLDALPEQAHGRSSLHQGFHLSELYPGMQVHSPERWRKETKALSTSFHHPQEAMEEGAAYAYFFCSPIFRSLSKAAYEPQVRWNISQWPEEIRGKAVALGGMSAAQMGEAQQRGFQHFAFLGAVWMADEPIKAFSEILQHANS